MWPLSSSERPPPVPRSVAASCGRPAKPMPSTLSGCPATSSGAGSHRSTSAPAAASRSASACCSATSSRARLVGPGPARRVEGDQLARERDELLAALADAVDQRLLVGVERRGAEIFPHGGERITGPVRKHGCREAPALPPPRRRPGRLSRGRDGAAAGAAALQAALPSRVGAAGRGALGPLPARAPRPAAARRLRGPPAAPVHAGLAGRGDGRASAATCAARARSSGATTRAR